ncbi:MAG: hypothetical protein ACI9VI_002624 [Candidatus Azotimanducaceae bacterium]|jgi:hypothetical protein
MKDAIKNLWSSQGEDIETLLMEDRQSRLISECHSGLIKQIAWVFGIPILAIRL